MEEDKKLTDYGADSGSFTPGNHLDSLIEYVVASYYTPTKEEFCVGLVYEWLVLEDDNFKNFKPGDWIENIMGLYNMSYAETCLNRNWIRVKYLDKQDIEELGWVSTPGASTYQKGTSLLILFKNNILEIRDLGNNPSYQVSRFFLGRIKNKSELKRLMEQLDLI